MRSNIFSAFLLGTLVASTALVAGCSSEGASDDESNDAVVGGPTATAVVDVPFYFGVPKSSMNRMTADMRKKHSFPTAWNPSKDNPEVGLRVIAVDNSPAGRAKMAKELAAAGIIQAGDVILSFRPNLAETIPYAHIQMGTTHAGLASVASDGVASTTDQPLDGEYNQRAFQAKHYLELGAFHIIRPRAFDAQYNPGAEARKERLNFWLTKVRPIVGTDARPKFNSNYLSPATATNKLSAAQLSTKIGKDLLAGNLSEFQFFCSELAYHLITLSNCSEEEIATAGDTAQCTTTGAPFPMMGIAEGESPGGLGEGPLLSLLASKGGGADIMALGKKVFDAPNPGSKALSPGHQGANLALGSPTPVDQHDGLPPHPGVDPGFKGLSELYKDRLGNGNAPIPASLAVAMHIPANYSPTAFLINSLKDSAHRGTDYVATVVFADANQMATAKTLSKQPIPNTDSTTP